MDHSNPKAPFPRLPRYRSFAIGFAIPVLAVLGLVAVWMVVLRDPGIRRQVVSGSMEPSVPGPIRWSQCRECNARTGFCADSCRDDLPPRCVHCGSAIQIDSDRELPAPIEYQTTNLDSLRIGDQVVFQSDEDGRFELKRIIGLPGEKIELLQGDLWINQMLHKKTLKQFLRQAILVDTISDETHPRTRWLHQEQPLSSLAHVQENSIYRFWDPIRNSPTIGDDFWMNPGERLHPIPMSDIGFLLHLSSEDPSDVWVSFTNGDELVEGNIRSSHGEVTLKATLRATSKESAASSTIRRLWKIGPHPNWIFFGTIDGRILFGGESDQGYFEVAFALPAHFRWNQGSALSWSVDGDQRPRRITVLRDIYYRLSPSWSDGILASNREGWTLLGDNVSLSADSRTRFPDGIPSSKIRGKLKESRNYLESIWRQISIFY